MLTRGPGGGFLQYLLNFSGLVWPPDRHTGTRAQPQHHKASRLNRCEWQPFSRCLWSRLNRCRPLEKKTFVQGLVEQCERRHITTLEVLRSNGSAFW